MKLPVSRVVILGERYKINVKNIPEGFGRVIYKDCVLDIHPEQSTDSARDTLLHEIVHALDHAESLRLTEEQVRRVAPGLRAVFAANPKVARFVSE